MPSKYGFGNTRKRSPYSMGKAHYGKDQKNPVMLTKAQETLPVNLQKEILAKEAEESPMGMYGKTPVKKYKNAAQRMAVHASKAEKKKK